MSDSQRTGVGRQPQGYDEPVFPPADTEPAFDEPVFAPVDEPPASSQPAEPVFEAVPAQTRGVSLPVDVAHSQVGWETEQPQPRRERKAARLPRWLQTSHPLWSGVAMMAVVLLIALWFSFGRSGDNASTAPGEPAGGVVGSVLIRQPDPVATAPTATEPTPSSDPAAVPSARLGAGANVIVANTGGQGIRLRSAPGTGSQTLGIYDEGAPFLVLPPGGDYGDYPVEADGYFWYRIRVIEDPADQLVGWAAGDFLVEREEQ